MATIPARPKLFDDTTPEAEAVLISLLRAAPGWKKLQMMCQLNASMKEIAQAGLRHRHPQASDAEIRRHLADLLLGKTMAERVLGQSDEQ
ncbi:MAG: hypothetical protein HY328_15525 [Chloroflexi bacterium]|nr:hypothetical protein [Chloroflexota bacterium]